MLVGCVRSLRRCRQAFCLLQEKGALPQAPLFLLRLQAQLRVLRVPQVLQRLLLLLRAVLPLEGADEL